MTNTRKAATYHGFALAYGELAGRAARYPGKTMTKDTKTMRGQTRHLFQMAGRRPVFHLYISGATPRSTEAITNLKPVLEKIFDGEYDLRVTDIFQEPQEAHAAGVDLAPTLVREYPAPVLKMVGNFSSGEEIRSLLIARLSNETPDE